MELLLFLCGVASSLPLRKHLKSRGQTREIEWSLKKIFKEKQKHKKTKQKNNKAKEGGVQNPGEAEKREEKKMSNERGGSGKVVCVTGASGYIASWLVKFLLQRGYTVKASVRDTSQYSSISLSSCLGFCI